MIRIQVRSIHQHAVRTFIQIWNLLWEPWHVFHLWRKKQPSNIKYLYCTLKKVTSVWYCHSFMYRFLQAGGCQARPSRARSRVSSAAEWSREAARGCCRSLRRSRTLSYAFWIFWTRCAPGWRGFPVDLYMMVNVILFKSSKGIFKHARKSCKHSPGKALVPWQAHRFHSSERTQQQPGLSL